MVENVGLGEQDVMVADPCRTKSPRIEISVLESLRTSLKDEITFEIKGLLLESQRDILKKLKPKTRENLNKENELNSGAKRLSNPY